MNRLEIRRRALHAAVAVSLTSLAATLGCAPVVDSESDPVVEEEETPVAVPPVASAVPTETPEEPELLGNAPALPEAMVVDCNQAADWGACCEAVSWDWNAGCQAWGPPMPPSMRPAGVA